MKKSALSISGAMIVITILSAATSWGAMWDNTMNINTGVDIVRTWTDVQNAGYAYGAKQTYDSLAGTTRVWLPYGNVDGVYYDANNVGFADAGAAALAYVASNAGNASCFLTYKFLFTQPIGTLKLSVGNTNWNLEPYGTDVTAGAVEYSTNGTAWTPAWSGNSDDNPYNKVKDPLLDNYLVTGLDNQELYLRFRTYNQTNPANTVGGNRWMFLRTSGHPAWGGAAFFDNQMQLEVTTVPEPAALSLLVLGGLVLYRRRR